MNVLEAHEHFARRGADRSIFPHSVSLAGNPQADVWPAVCVAAVSLAGHLDDAKSDADLDAGIQAFESYVEMGVLADDQLEPAVLDVIGELLEWGDALAGGMDCDPACSAAHN